MIKLLKILLLVNVAVAIFIPTIPAQAQPLINEFMASNTTTIQDEDGDYSDWIEIYNPGDSPIDLTGYGLSDRSNNPYKWAFPKRLLNPDQYMLIYASGKDRINVPNHWETVIDQGDEWKYFTGISEPQENWHSIEFDDSEWQSGPSSIGSRDDNTTIIPQTISLYIRKTFNIDDITNITHCRLHIDYQDAFVAYINGHEIARANIGEVGITPSYDEQAIKYRFPEMFDGGIPEVFEINNFQSFLQSGENVLAIQIHNKFQSPFKDSSVIPFLTLGMLYPPSNPQGVPEILDFSFSFRNLHTNFKISTEGETLVLSDNYGVLCDSVFTKIFGTDISMGRKPDGGKEWVIFFNPTPGESNITDGFKLNEDLVVEISHPGGFYDTGISLELSTDSQTAEIRYTLDGSEPSKSSTLYTSAVSIDTTTVIRACAYDENLFISKIVTHTYLINENKYLPVISLSTDPKNFWDDDIGIYVDHNRFKDWERPIHIEFYEPDGNLGFSIDAGAEIHGGTSQMSPQRSFSIFARKKYGYSEISYQIFPDLPITEFKSIVLRNSGSNWNGTHLRDALCQSLVKDIDLDIQAYRPAVVYINGVYWGIYNIREKQNEEYLASHHGIDPDNVDMLDGQGEIIEGDDLHFNALKEYILSHDMSDSVNYNYIKTQMDLSNFINYYVAQIYFGNTDWQRQNIKYWHQRTPEGKWRWLLCDVDAGLFRGSHNLLEEISTSDDSILKMLNKLLNNENFKNDFISRFADYYNTIFHPTKVIQTIEEMKKVIEPEMNNHLERWGELGFSDVTTFESWNKAIEELKNVAKDRADSVFGHFIDYFDLSGSAFIELDVSHPSTGKIKINTLAIDEFPWNSIYFKDDPVQLTAIPNPGYRFAGWAGITSSDSSSITITLIDSILVTANFEEDSTALNIIVINEINYNSSVDFDPEDWVELYNAYNIPIDISGWVFKDEDDTHIFELPANTVIASNGYFVLCNDATAFHNAFPNVSNYTGSFDFGLSGQGELIRLYDANGVLIDWLIYDDAVPWPAEPDGNGPTLALLNPARDNTLPEYWASSGEHGTPGAKNDVYSGVDEDAETDVPIVFSIGQNYPNPFNSVTTIPFSVPKTGFVLLTVYNITGQKIRELVTDTITAGTHSVTWDGKDENGMMVSSGIYLSRLTGGGNVTAGRMLLMK